MLSREDTISRLRAQPPTVIGLGAIGSWVARWLTANGIAFRGYDDDRVALKNVTAGAFEAADVGKYKSAVVGAQHGFRWNSGEMLSGAALVCADHGETRRNAAQVAGANDIPFICAKANGVLWQVWHVAAGNSPDDFVAFDEAAEANPVTVPCGDPSVGRVASIGAAAEMLSAWSGLEISPEEVESSFGVSFDPAIAHVMGSEWNINREESARIAEEVAAAAAREKLDKLRAESDSDALRKLEQKRLDRANRKRVNRATIHQQAIVRVDGGTSLRDAAFPAWARRHPLHRIIAAEATLNARTLERELAIPDTITIEEVA